MIRGMSGATSPMRSAGARVAWAMLPPNTLRASNPRIALAAGREEGGKVGLAVADHEQDFVDPREVHHRLQRRVVEERGPSVVDAAHMTDGHAAREHAALPRRHHQVAHRKS